MPHLPVHRGLYVLVVLIISLSTVTFYFNYRIITEYRRGWKYFPVSNIVEEAGVPGRTQFVVPGVNCAALINGDRSEVAKVKALTPNYTDFHKIQLEAFLNDNTHSCLSYVKSRGYVVSPLGEEENRFPIAYSILIYKDLHRFERLLRAVYRPQNFYCIHVDRKSPEGFLAGTKALAECFPNVALASRAVDVYWGEFSVLEADMICMKDLLRFHWKYFINLTGEEFPLKTNKQLVKIFKAFRGANDIRGSSGKLDSARVEANGKAPHNITLMKGPVHIAASREFVQFLFNDDKVQSLYNWLRGTAVPDETFFSTVNNNPQLGAPGAFRGPPSVRETKWSSVRYKVWKGNQPCSGRFQRGVCIFDIGDLPRLAKSEKLFANKFLSDYGNYAYDCMEELHWNRTLQEYITGQEFNTSYYSHMVHVKYLNNIKAL